MAGVSVGVIEQFLHPPLGAMTRELIVGPISGSGTLTRPRGPIAVDAFGIQASVFSAPAGWGFIDGDPNIYIHRYGQFAVKHTLLDGGDVYSEITDLYYDGQLFVWQSALPTALHYYVEPGFVLTLRWLLAL